MLCAGLVHGDLPNTTLVGPTARHHRFPQVVNAAGNNAARAMLLRDVNIRPRSGGSHPNWKTRVTPRKCGHCSRRANCSVASSPAHIVDDDTPVDIDAINE